MEINISFGSKNKLPKPKLPKLKKVKEIKIKESKIKPVKVKKKRQYTKIIIDMVIGLTLITTLASIYINFKNGMGLDSVVSSCWEGLKYIIPSYACKSFFETKEEKLMEFQEKHFNDINSIDLDENEITQNNEKDV